METITINKRRINANDRIEKYKKLVSQEWQRESRLEMIQMLIPLGLRAVAEELQLEVTELAGNRYSRGKTRKKRWGYNPGSVYLGDQKVSIRVPRVRDVEKDQEVCLTSYEALQDARVIDDRIFRQVINGISTQRYERAAELVPQTFGIKRDSISQKFIQTAAKKLKACLNRDLSRYDIVAIFMDGKWFGENSMVVAMGVTLTGQKIILGFIETSTENHIVCRDFMNSLKDRGLNMSQDILFIIDGAKGLRKGIAEVLGAKAVVQRCQWHKRENVVMYLDKKRQPEMRNKLQSAYEQPTYEAAKKQLDTIKKELKLINESALHSLEEGLEETLTLHRLGMFEKIGASFKTTNCIETIMSKLEMYTRRITHWKNSDQRRRWVGAALMEIEPTLRSVRGFGFLNELRVVMKNDTAQIKKQDAA